MPKPITSLTVADLSSHPLWVFVDPDDAAPDETWIKPLRLSRIPRGVYSVLAASRFVTAADLVLPGFMLVSTADRKIEIDPGAIVRPRYQVLPSVGVKEARKARLAHPLKVRIELLRLLRRQDKSVFPIQYLVRVPLAATGTFVSGMIE